MTCTVEKVLGDARLLVTRLKDHDNSADNLIAQTQTLHKRMDAMKQYQDDLNELNEIARHRPRANLIMGLLQENNQIRELQQENRELRNSLEEHQSAIELIMSKYREQVAKLMMANKLDNQGATENRDESQLREDEEIEEKIDKICEMAVVMQQAIRLDEAHDVQESRVLSQLKFENQTLRELLRISSSSGSLELDKVEQETQTEDVSDAETTEDECNRSVIFRGPELVVEKGDTESVSESDKGQNDSSADESYNPGTIKKSPRGEMESDEGQNDSSSADESYNSGTIKKSPRSNNKNTSTDAT